MPSLYDAVAPFLDRSLDHGALAEAMRDVASDMDIEVFPRTAVRQPGHWRKITRRGKACAFVDSRVQGVADPDLVFAPEYLLRFVQQVVRNLERRAAKNRVTAVLNQLEPTTPGVATLTIKPRREEEIAGGRGQIFY